MARQTIQIFTLLVTLRRIGSMFIMGIYSIYLREHGMSLLQMNLVNATYFGSMLLFELPTGAIADVFGRKKAFFLSSLFIAMGFIFYGFSDSMPKFIVAEMLVAIGTTFESGTFKAWLVDRLHHFGHFEEDLGNIFAKAGRLGTALGAISSIIGAKTLAFWMPLPWIIGGSIFLISGIAACFLMKEEYFTTSSRSFLANIRHSKTAICEGCSIAIANQTILYLFLIGLISCISVQAVNMQWPILLKPIVGGANANVGFLGAAISLSLAAGLGIAPWLKARFVKDSDVIVWIQVMTGICIIASIILVLPYFVLPTFFLHEVLRGAYQPIKDSFVQKSIKNKDRRATISSFESISNHIGSIFGLVLSGLWAESNTIQSTWIISGCFLIAGTLVMSRLIRKN